MTQQPELKFIGGMITEPDKEVGDGLTLPEEE
jgi:hypothetical protein